MSDCDRSFWNPDFSHVYIEEDILDHPRTAKILSHLTHSSVIPVPHYKDVFCRKNQQFAAQKQSMKLILARKREPFLYKGSPMCDDFGHENFFYTSDIMNCMYQCEYCYLQGMYPSANIVVFVNLEDTFLALEARLKEKPMYVCISYDTDLLAFENLTGFVADWIGFASRHLDLTIESRTKSANFSAISAISPQPNVILAWSISPASIADSLEKHTPPLRSRLRSMREAIEKGWKVRLCVDPMLCVEDWERIYDRFFEEVQSALPLDQLFDFSIGVFRVPKESLKAMRGIHPGSMLLSYPFTLSESGWSYPEEQKSVMMDYLKDRFGSATAH